MRYRLEITPQVQRLLEHQCGLITHDQAAGVGLSPDLVRRLVGQGHWRRVSEGLYDASPLQVGFQRMVWTAVLHAGPGAAVGGDAALRLCGLDRPAGTVVVWVPPSRQVVQLPGIRVRRDGLGRTERAGGEPARISIADAVVDVGQGISTTALAALLANASRTRLLDRQALSDALEIRRRVRGRARFVGLLADLEGIESVLELEYQRQVEQAHGLPAGTRQLSVSLGTRSDVGYDAYGVLVELDGRLGHADADSAFRDLARDNRHAARGWVTLRYGSADVRGRPCLVAAQVASVLGSRGWSGQLRRCPRCLSKAVS